MKKLIGISFLVIVCYFQSVGQQGIHFELQAYPTGIIPGLRYEKSINEKSSVHLRVGYQYIRHRDLGKHDDERGSGYGFTVGYKHYLSKLNENLAIALRSDVWWNSLDWEDGENPVRTGHSDITVLQPTVELSYALGGELFSFTPSLAFGYEWNVKTEGEATGEGAIVLIGFITGLPF